MTAHVFLLINHAKADAGVLPVEITQYVGERCALREEAQRLLADVKAQKVASEKLAADMLANAAEEAKRLHADAQVKLAEQIERRGVMAERKIAQAEAQAANDVRAAAGDLAASMAEQVLTARIAVAKSDPLVDVAIGQLAGRLQ